MSRHRRTVLASIAVLATTMLLSSDPVWAAGTFVVAPGRSGPSGPGSVLRFSVEVETGLGERPVVIAREVERRVFDHRSWGAEGRISFQRVPRSRAHVRILLASPTTTDQLCAPLPTAGIWNCRAGDLVVMNHLRWRVPRVTYGTDVEAYRSLIVMHELGHYLGHGHAGCPGAGRLAPPMMQQGKGLHGCRRNPWPFPRAVRPRATCELRARPSRAPGFVRYDATVRWIGSPAIVRIQERTPAGWRVVSAAPTSVDGRVSRVIRTSSSFLRLRYDGAAHRRACGTVVAIR